MECEKNALLASNVIIAKSQLSTLKTLKMLSTLRQRTKLSSTFIGIAVSIPILATAQGAYLLTKFRSNHKDAPYPKSPCQGIVIVSPQDSMSDNADNYDHGSNQKFKNDNFHQKWLTIWKNNQILNTNNLFRKDKLQKQSPLRIFVVGDSLAAGVGSTSGTPVLPEAIAKSLSKALGGRPVHWTCHGTPGKLDCWMHWIFWVRVKL